MPFTNVRRVVAISFQCICKSDDIRRHAAKVWALRHACGFTPRQQRQARGFASAVGIVTRKTHTFLRDALNIGRRRIVAPKTGNIAVAGIIEQN